MRTVEAENKNVGLAKILRNHAKSLEWLAEHPEEIVEFEDSVSAELISICIRRKDGGIPESWL